MPTKRNEQEFYPIQMDFLPDDFHQKAVTELNETPERLKVELKNLKELLSGVMIGEDLKKFSGSRVMRTIAIDNKITTGIEFEDEFLRMFLRHTKYNSSKAFSYVRNFVSFRRNYGSLFTSIPDENFETNPSTKMFSVLPYRSPDGCAIMLSEIGKWNPDELSLEDFKRMGIFLFLQPLRCPMTQISGFKIIHDFKDTSVKYLRYCTPQNLYLFYNVAMNCVPGRYKEVHCINESVLLKAVWSIVKHFLSAKIRKRVFFHSKPEDLLNYFPPFILPAKYGGTLHDYHNTDLMRKMNKEHGNYPLGGQPNYF